MPSAFDSLLAATASPMLDQHFGELVVISRGSNATSGVLASWLGQATSVDSADSIATQLFDREWLIKKADYLIAWTVVEPQRGDRITDADGVVWEILPAASDLRSIESYEAGERWLLKTKRVS